MLYFYIGSVVFTFIVICVILLNEWWNGNKITSGDLYSLFLSFIPVVNLFFTTVLIIGMVENKGVIFKGKAK